MGKQLELFNPIFPEYKPRLYRNLSIHERINIKCNTHLAKLCYIRFYWKENAHLIGFKYDQLDSKYLIHYRINSGYKNRIDNYTKSLESKQLKLF